MNKAALLVALLWAWSRRDAPKASAPTPTTTLYALDGLERTTPGFRVKLVHVASRLGIDPNHLGAAMAFESRFNPRAKNPKSGAIGLIQFMSTTAKRLGTTTAELASMTAEQQLSYVEDYFNSLPPSKYGRFWPLTRIADVYLAIFSPANVGAPDSRLDHISDGDATARQAINRVKQIYEEGRARGPFREPTQVVLPPVIITDPDAPASPAPAGTTSDQNLGPVPVGPALGNAELTSEMVAWSHKVLASNPKLGDVYGPREFATRPGAVPGQFGTMPVLARVETHGASPQIPHPHKGVGLHHVP